MTERQDQSNFELATARRFSLKHPCVCIVLLCAIVSALAPPRSSIAQEPSRGSAAGPATAHGLVMFLPDHPIFIRCWITNNEQSLNEVRDAYLQSLVAKLDVNMDGKVGFDETLNHPLFVSGRRFTNNKFLNSLRSKKTYSDAQLRMAVDRAAGQIVSIREDNSLIDRDLSVLSVLDADGSGIIDRFEMRSAPTRIADRDGDFDQVITLGEFVDEPEVDPLVQSSMIDSITPPTSVHSNLLRSVKEPILAPRLVRVYDRDKDACLSKEELKWSSERFAELDQDSNGKLTTLELNQFPASRPDVELSIELSQSESGAPSIELLSSQPTVTVRAVSPHQISLGAESVSLSIQFRPNDPVSDGVRDGLFVFNSLDIDANGYLDRTEIADHQRFERYLFAAMDSDGDERVFSEELENYVRAYLEPTATTCQIRLFDMGSGYFQLIDTNGDGRISIRELRGTEDALLAVSESDAINSSMQPKTYHIDVGRGGGSLFGTRAPLNQANSDIFAQQVVPSGPVWFQRMDRNSDGDLTWDEFLGPRDVFHQLDTDGDNLIGSFEATAAR